MSTEYVPEPRVFCSKCGKDEVLCYLTAETAVCPECCEDHDYVADSGERYCQHCGANPPDDWYYCDDDVPLWGLGPIAASSDGPIGIPASAMNGNAMARDQDPAAWDRWVAFCNACGHP